MSGDTYGCHNSGGGHYWHLVGRGQGCCSTVYSAQDGPCNMSYPAPNVKKPQNAKNTVTVIVLDVTFKHTRAAVSVFTTSWGPPK